MLQYITHFNDKYDYVEGAILALKGGCKWIQLRMKDASKEEILEKAVLLKRECLKYNARLIIDDHVDIVIPSGADGVHLGKNDMDPSEARAILGKEKVIGGTANSFDDIKTLNSKGVDYIGLGPFRFTTTKKNLSEIIGKNGYSKIVNQCRINNIDLPIVAIGGILKEDIAEIIATGIPGIALSGAILNSADPIEETKEILKILDNIE